MPLWLLDAVKIVQSIGAILLTCVVIYALFCTLLLLCPRAQREVAYLHGVKVPFCYPGGGRLDLNDLLSLGLVQYTRNVKILTADGETLGCWHFAPTSFGPALSSLNSSESSRDTYFDELLAEPKQGVIVFLHGKVGTRGLRGRLETCKALAGQLQLHVLMIDYRGFGDSTGAPSEDGLVLDAQAAWTWLGQRRKTGAIVYGQSLGAAVAIKFCAALAAAGGAESQKLQGLILDVPFLNAVNAVLRVPLFYPFRVISCLTWVLRSSIVDAWDNQETIKNVRCPILLVGAGRDSIVGGESAMILHDIAIKARRAVSGAFEIGQPCEIANHLEIGQASETVCQDTVWLAFLENAAHDNTWAFPEWLDAVAKFVQVAPSLPRQPGRVSAASEGCMRRPSQRRSSEASSQGDGVQLADLSPRRSGCGAEDRKGRLDEPLKSFTPRNFN